MRLLTDFIRSGYERMRSRIDRSVSSEAPPEGPPTESQNSDLAQYEQARALHQQGQLNEAEEIYRKLLQKYPNDFDLLHMLGTVHGQRSDFAAAVVFIEQAITIDPDSAAAHGSHGNCLKGMGRYDQALVCYDRALALQPDDADTWNNRGAALRDLKRPAEALDSFDRALAANPDHVAALDNRGTALRDLQRPEEALASHDKALAIAPNYSAAHCNRGNALWDLKRHEEARASFERALILNPDNSDAINNVAMALTALGQYEAALANCDKALRLNSNDPVALCNRGAAMDGLKRYDDALASYDRALALVPDYAIAHNNRGAALSGLNRHDEALTGFERAITFKPDFADAHSNRGNVLRDLRRPEEAILSYSRALALKPDDARTHSNKIFCMNYLPEFGFAEYQTEMRRWYEAHGSGLARTPLPYRTADVLTRRLVVGYVSADFMKHSAAIAFGPVLRHHDKSRFEIVCYSDVVDEDERTREFRQLADRWCPIARMTDAALSAKIAADGIDILVDLSGHSAGNRLLTFARRPAPVQVTGWGYATGTGLPTIDYFFSDSVATPPEVRPLFAETVYDLPCFITFDPPDYAPPVSDAPVLRRGAITFGCLNSFYKVSKSNLELWAQILQAVPHSRLLMKDIALSAPSNQTLVMQTMAKHGISLERIELRGGSSHQVHLAAYGDVDIALDPFPYNGGITTWEALWMGVPVLSKLGGSSSGRTGGAILSALGLCDWVVSAASDYVALAADKAARIDELACFRRKTRAIISSSPAGNPVLYTRAVETAYMKMWHDCTRPRHVPRCESDRPHV